MANRTQSKHINKKHMARMQKEKKQIRTLTMIASIVVIAVILLVAFGIFGQTIIRANQPVAEIGGEKISTKSFEAHVRLTRQQLINQYSQYLQFAQMFGLDPSTNPNIANALQQIQFQLEDPISLGEGVLNQMIDNIVIRQEANRMEISVSSDEVEAAIQAALGYTPNGTPTPTITPTTIVYPTLNPTQVVLFPPSPSPTNAPSSTPGVATSTLIPTSMPNTSPSPTSIPIIQPTVTPYTFDAYEIQYQDMVTSYDTFGLPESDVRLLFEDALYRDKLYPLITGDVPHTSEMVWARHILVADEATAIKVRNELLNDGDWTLLATKYSSDTGSSSNGGDLGWFQRGVMVAEFEDSSFSLEIGDISLPIQTNFGYHLIQVLGHEERPLTEQQYLEKTDQIFVEWLSGIRLSTDITIHDYYKERIPVDPTLQDAFG